MVAPQYAFLSPSAIASASRTAEFMVVSETVHCEATLEEDA
jgi:hypothetical protein